MDTVQTLKNRVIKLSLSTQPNYIYAHRRMTHNWFWSFTFAVTPDIHLHHSWSSFQQFWQSVCCQLACRSGQSISQAPWSFSVHRTPNEAPRCYRFSLVPFTFYLLLTKVANCFPLKSIRKNQIEDPTKINLNNFHLCIKWIKIYFLFPSGALSLLFSFKF